MPLRFDNDRPISRDAMIFQIQQPFFDEIWKGGGIDFETQVNGARNLVDILTARSLSPNGMEFNFAERDGNFTRNLKHIEYPKPLFLRENHIKCKNFRKSLIPRQFFLEKTFPRRYYFEVIRSEDFSKKTKEVLQWKDLDVSLWSRYLGQSFL